MIITGSSLDVLKTFPDNYFDSVCTDPPYGIEFMNKKWDYDVPTVDLWREVYRVLKPGGHALIACGTRTQHRMAVNIEDAGFEVRDVITWLYGSGFPKSLDVSKAIDKMYGAEREVIGFDAIRLRPNRSPSNCREGGLNPDNGATITAPATDHAKQWQGFGTALKPACEFWTLVRKPLAENTVAKNVLKYGTGALNIDGCRVDGVPRTTHSNGNIRTKSGNPNHGDNPMPLGPYEAAQGRFPANLILDEEAGALLDLQSGILSSGARKGTGNPKYKSNSYNASSTLDTSNCESSVGGASRFFYCAKASKSERNAGLDLAPVKVNDGRNTPIDNPFQRGETERVNSHPTVKPIKLMEYLCKLITPPGGIVLDPFAGSGSTGVAAKNLGFQFIGIELNPEYAEIARNRVSAN